MNLDETQTDYIGASEGAKDNVSETDVIPFGESASESYLRQILETLQYIEDKSQERDEALEERLNEILASVSENTVDESEDEDLEDDEDDVVRSGEALRSGSLSKDDLQVIENDVSDLLDVTVSANTVSKDDIIHRELSDYTVSEALLLALTLGFLGFLLIYIFKS